MPDSSGESPRAAGGNDDPILLLTGHKPDLERTPPPLALPRLAFLTAPRRSQITLGLILPQDFRGRFWRHRGKGRVANP